MKKLVTLFLILSIFVLIVSGCATPQGTTKAADTATPTTAASTTSETTATETKKLIFIPKSLDQQFWVTMGDAAKAEAEAKGYSLDIQAPNAQSDVLVQIGMVENAIVLKYDAILLAPSDSTALAGAIKKANDANIPVFTIDTKMDKTALNDASAKVVTFVGSDNVQAGALAAEFVGKAIKEGEVIVLEGASGQESGEDRKNGFVEELKKYSNITIVESQTANWDRLQAYNAIQNLLQVHPNVKAIFGCNDEMALGAAKLIGERNLKSKVIIVGIDASKDALAAIKEGQMDATVAQYPDQMGITAVAKAIEFLNGGSIDAIVPVAVKLQTIENIK